MSARIHRGEGNEDAHPIGKEAAQDASPAVERVPDERAEGDLCLGVPDRSEDRHPRRHDRLQQPQEKSVRGQLSTHARRCHCSDDGRDTCLPWCLQSWCIRASCDAVSATVRRTVRAGDVRENDRPPQQRRWSDIDRPCQHASARRGQSEDSVLIARTLPVG